MSGARWLANARACHTRALGSVQAFPLFGDGDNVAGILAAPERDSEACGAALAEARYRDWLNARMTGARDYVPRGDAYVPPLALVPDDMALTQTRLPMPVRVRDRAPIEEARAIMRALVEEFSDLFPDECGAAVAWLARQTD